MQVIKRNGQLVDFSRGKIENAINKAFLEADGVTNDEIAVTIAERVETIASLNDTMTVEQIQDLVERNLIAAGCADVAKRYIKYRYLHELARAQYSELMKAINEKLLANNVQNQNANVDEHSFGGRVGEASDLVMKRFALDYCMSKRSKENHLNNEIYIHDLSAYPIGMHNCLTIPIDELAAKGAIVRGSKILRPCGSFTSFGQLSAVWMQLQSLQQFGGVSYSHYDWSAVPYVRKSFYKHYIEGLKYINGVDIDVPFDSNLEIDDYEYRYNNKVYEYALAMTEKEVYQTIEALYHNLNTLQSRSGNQLPFSSINYGTCTLPEGRMVTKALLEVSIEGIGEMHTTSIFPCGIMVLKKGINRKPGDPNYDLFELALKSTARRLYPNYANGDALFQQEWLKYDRLSKEKIINNLSEADEQLLIQLIDANPDLGQKLDLEIINNGMG